MMQFKDLTIGDEFDFIGPDPTVVSFWERCRKTSARTYRDTKRNVYRIGTTACSVYHVNETGKSPGQLAYELDCQRKPTYHDGAPRRPWEALGDVVKLSWERNPTPRDYAVAN